MLHLEKRQLRQFSLICAAAALAVVLITLFIVFLTSGQEDEPPAPSSSGVEGPVIPEGMRLFEDLYEGEVIIPKERCWAWTSLSFRARWTGMR